MTAETEHRACLACAGRVTDETWRTLPLAQTMAEDEIRRNVCTWPERAKIEVRRCRGCGREIARTVRT